MPGALFLIEGNKAQLFWLIVYQKISIRSQFKDQIRNSERVVYAWLSSYFEFDLYIENGTAGCARNELFERSYGAQGSNNATWWEKIEKN